MKILVVLLGLVTAVTISFAQQVPLRIAVVVDRSASVLSHMNQLPSAENLLPLLQRVDESGGELTLITVGVNGKRNEIRYTSASCGIKPEKARGQTANDYREELRAYLLCVKAAGTRSPNDFVNRQDVKEVFDFSSLEGSSDVAGAIETAYIFLQEQGEPGTRQILLAMTDGQNNVDTYDLPPRIPGDLIIVNRSANVGVLQAYQHSLFANFEAAIRFICNG